MRKDGATIATALVNVTTEVVDACLKGLRRNKAPHTRIVHLIVGDGINTNENALKRVLRFSIKLVQKGPCAIASWRGDVQATR